MRILFFFRESSRYGFYTEKWYEKLNEENVKICIFVVNSGWKNHIKSFDASLGISIKSVGEIIRALGANM